MKEYSITEKDLKEIIDFVKDGYRCLKIESDETLYIKLVKYDHVHEFEFPKC